MFVVRATCDCSVSINCVPVQLSGCSSACAFQQRYQLLYYRSRGWHYDHGKSCIKLSVLCSGLELKCAFLQPQLIQKYGYPVENHEATSADGYIISLTRIPASKPNRHPYPILLVHGLLGSSGDYLVIGPNNSIAYLLADRGYDVWLADMRGNRYSQKHVRLTIDSPDYWDFSWHEMGYYDMPAIIEYILHQTTARKLIYIGHSQGTTVFFVMASARPEFNDKIARMYALSPAVCLKRLRSPVSRWLIDHAYRLKELFDMFGVQQFLPHSDLTYYISGIICPMSDENNICMQIVSQTVGPNPKMVDMVSSRASE